MSHDDVAARLLIALEHGDEVALASLLTRDARMVVDSGDATGGEVRGRVQVVRALLERRSRHPHASVQAVQVNGGRGLALRRDDGEVIGVMSIDAGRRPGVGRGADTISAVWLSTAPAKLARWNRR